MTMRPMKKLPDDREEVSTGNKKKNTRRWCKGKRGVEHVCRWRKWNITLPFPTKREPPMVYACEKCEKVFGTWFSYWDGKRGIPRPTEGQREK